MTNGPLLSVAIDTAADLAGIALFEDEALLAEATWRSRQNHSRELLPTLEWLLQRSQRTKADLGAVFVCLGPGSYAGLRVGLSTAKALAYGLGLPIAGVGRLAADALTPAVVSGVRVASVHAAGRAELAWAVYAWNGEDLTEVAPPQLGPAPSLLATLSRGDIVCGEIDKLDASVAGAVMMAGARLVEAPVSRAVAVARLGLRRLVRDDVDNVDALVPLYLRAPAIGPQRPL
jgi:tRNA threonylcarbamoyladenosine biosynthesis protein TsaB